jgi:tripartite-type tricarboxylate transporter receptor subunit TctC
MPIARRSACLLAVGLGLALSTLLVRAQPAPAYPSKPVHLVVPYPPGGASDLLARVLGQKMGEVWKQTVIIDNKPGGGGSIGTEYAARQPADGYTFLIGNMGPMLINPLITKVAYNVNKDFTGVALIATGPSVLVVNSNSPFKTLHDLIAAAKAKPNTLNFGSGGTGTLAQLGGEMLNQSAGIQMQHVPYKGGIAAINDVLAGQLDMIVADTQGAVQHIKSGKLRALAMTSEKRFPLLPDVPTFEEAGVKGLVALSSWAIYLPVGVPKPVQDQFRAALDKAMVDPGLVKQYAELGVEAMHTSAEELRKFNEVDTARFARIVKEKNIKAD